MTTKTKTKEEKKQDIPVEEEAQEEVIEEEEAEYVCVNEAKLKRVINGSMASGGKLQGGLGEDASKEAILAEYDKLGGMIIKDGIKVKTGSFYDFENKKVRTKPKVILLFTDVTGTVVEVPEGEALPPTVAAQQFVEKEKAKKEKDKKK